MQLADPSLSMLVSPVQITLWAFQKTKAILLSVVCSAAATNSPGSWQQVMQGKAMHWLAVLNAYPKRKAVLQAQTLTVHAACFWLLWLLHTVTTSQKKWSGLWQRQAKLLPETQQAGSISPISRLRGAISVYTNEQIEHSDFTALEQPFVRNCNNTGRLSFPYFEFYFKKYLERIKTPHYAKSHFRSHCPLWELRFT